MPQPARTACSLWCVGLDFSMFAMTIILTLTCRWGRTAKSRSKSHTGQLTLGYSACYQHLNVDWGKYEEDSKVLGLK